MLQRITANKTGKSRREKLHGKEYLVTPVRMIVPGVLTGNRGSLLYTTNEIKKSVSAWNGMPIVVNHPKEGDRYISARNPKVLNKYGVGFVFNATMTSGNLDGEAWIEIEKLQQIEPSLAKKVLRDELVEVSTGLGTENYSSKGQYNGKSYDAVAKNFAPDHLALLPNERGACSLEDGCGLAVNKMRDWVRAYDRSGTSMTFSVWSRTASLKESECSCKGKCDECKDKGTVNFQPTDNARVRNNMSWTFQPTTNAEGVWRTTDDGSKIYIKDGKAYAGGPKGKELGGKGNSSKSKTVKSVVDNETRSTYLKKIEDIKSKILDMDAKQKKMATTEASLEKRRALVKELSQAEEAIGKMNIKLNDQDTVKTMSNSKLLEVFDEELLSSDLRKEAKEELIKRGITSLQIKDGEDPFPIFEQVKIPENVTSKDIAELKRRHEVIKEHAEENKKLDIRFDSKRVPPLLSKAEYMAGAAVLEAEKKYQESRKNKESSTSKGKSNVLAERALEIMAEDNGLTRTGKPVRVPAKVAEQLVRVEKHLDKFVAGEASEVAALVKKYKVPELNKWLEDVFDGPKSAQYFE